MGLILLLEDSKSFRELIAALRSRGHEVAEGSDAACGLQLAVSLRPDLILSDIHMQVGDGLTLLKQIRQIPKSPPSRSSS